MTEIDKNIEDILDDINETASTDEAKHMDTDIPETDDFNSGTSSDSNNSGIDEHACDCDCEQHDDEGRAEDSMLISDTANWSKNVVKAINQEYESKIHETDNTAHNCDCNSTCDCDSEKVPADSVKEKAAEVIEAAGNAMTRAGESIATAAHAAADEFDADETKDAAKTVVRGAVTIGKSFAGVAKRFVTTLVSNGDKSKTADASD